MKGSYQETGIWQGRNAGAAAGLPDSAILIGKQAMPACEARLLENQKTLPVPHRISAPVLPASGSEAACACPARSGWAQKGFLWRLYSSFGWPIGNHWFSGQGSPASGVLYWLSRRISYSGLIPEACSCTRICRDRMSWHCMRVDALLLCRLCATSTTMSRSVSIPKAMSSWPSAAASPSGSRPMRWSSRA